MNKLTLLLILIVSVFTVSCSTTMTGDKSKLAAKTWELEYITGPRITFEGLFPDRKPMISFAQETNMVTGNSGCNGYQTKYTLRGNMISFAEPELSTMMYCGDGETVFRKTMAQIDQYRIEADGKLVLMMGDTVMMRFKPAIK